MVEWSERRRLSRRGVLGLLAVAGAVPVLQACSGLAPASKPAAEPTKPAAAAPAPTTAPAAAPTTAPAAGATTAPAAAPTTAPAAGATTARPRRRPASGVEIEVATRVGSDAEIMVKSVVDFTAQTGIKAKHVAYPAEPEYWAKVQALHATKQVADVIWASIGNLHNFANRGLLAELDPLIKGDNYDLGDYVPNALKTLSLNGKLYAMPWGGHPGTGGFSTTSTCWRRRASSRRTTPGRYDTLLDAVKKTDQAGQRADRYLRLRAGRRRLPGTQQLRRRLRRRLPVAGRQGTDDRHARSSRRASTTCAISSSRTRRRRCPARTSTRTTCSPAARSR